MKKFAVLLLVSLVAFGCKKDKTPDAIAVAELKLSQPTLSMATGETKTFTATISPENATNATITAKSSDESVATVAVDKNTITIKALKVGETTITVTVGDKTATCVVTTSFPAADIAILPGAGAERIYLVGTGDDATLQLTKEQNYTSAYFQFGSVIGYDASKEVVPIFNPTTTAITAWNSSWNSDALHSVENLKAGKGDPCRLVGYKASQVKAMLAANLLPDNGKWRTPTKEENVAFSPENTRKGWNTVNDYNGLYFPNSTSTTNWLPASGYRINTDGALTQVGSNGTCWSSTVGSTSKGFQISYVQSGITSAFANNQPNGFMVRCIPQ